MCKKSVTQGALCRTRRLLVRSPNIPWCFYLVSLASEHLAIFLLYYNVMVPETLYLFPIHFLLLFAERLTLESIITPL